MEGKVLITGSNGQLGQCFKNIVSYSKNENYIFTTRNEFDITNIDKMREYLKNHKDIRIIINCAAYTDVKKAEFAPGFKKALLINGEGPKNLAILCNEFNIFLVHIGTEYIMDLWNYIHNNKSLDEYEFLNFVINTHGMNHRENEPIIGNKYGYSKSDGIFNIIKTLSEKKNYVIIITSWLYSEYGDNFIKAMYNRIKNDLETEVVYTQVGSPTYAMDLAAYIIDMIENNDCKFVNDDNNIINFSNLGVASWYDLAKRVDIFEGSNRILPRKEPFDDIIRPVYGVLDLKKVRDICGNKEYLRHWTSALESCLEKVKYIDFLNKK